VPCVAVIVIDAPHDTRTGQLSHDVPDEWHELHVVPVGVDDGMVDLATDPLHPVVAYERGRHSFVYLHASC
jgi:hypothetical protein